MSEEKGQVASLGYSLSEEDRKRLELDRQNYDKLAAEQCLALDKSIIGIAGASFSVAIAFIDKIISMEKSFWLWSFWTAMLLLVTAIIVTTLSFWFSESAIRYARTCVDDCERTENIDELYKTNPWAKPLKVINQIRIGTFIGGMLLLGVFIFANGLYQSYREVKPIKHLEEVMSDNNQKSQPAPGKDSGRFGFEPQQPRPHQSSPQPQQQPQPQPAPQSSEKNNL